MLLTLIALLACATATETVGAQPASTTRGVIRGVVLDTLGRPTPNAPIILVTDSVSPATWPRSGVTRHQAQIAEGFTDASGRFAFSVAPHQRHALRAFAMIAEGRLDSLVVSEDDTLSVELHLKGLPHRETPARLRNERLELLTRQRALWTSQRPTRYRVDVRMDCYCGAEREWTTLEFLNDSLVEVVGGSSRPRIRWARFSGRRLFDEADDAIRDLIDS